LSAFAGKSIAYHKIARQRDRTLNLSAPLNSTAELVDRAAREINDSSFGFR